MKFAALIFLLTVSLVSAGAEVKTPSFKAYVLQPTDEAAKDPTFATFKKRVLQIAAKKDLGGLESVTSKTIQSSFGGDVADFKSFKETLRLDKDPNKSHFWSELERVFELGGTLSTDSDGAPTFEAPYVSSKWPEGFDSFEYAAVTAKDVPIRKSPNAKADLVEKISYLIVQQNVRSGAPGWIAVDLPSGKSGFIELKYLRSPTEYRAIFKKLAGEWKMTTFIAGD